jgi:hypothetical protein
MMRDLGWRLAQVWMGFWGGAHAVRGEWSWVAAYAIVLAASLTITALDSRPEITRLRRAPAPSIAASTYESISFPRVDLADCPACDRDEILRAIESQGGAMVLCVSGLLGSEAHRELLAQRKITGELPAWDYVWVGPMPA